MKKRYCYCSGLGLVGLLSLSMCFATDSSSVNALSFTPNNIFVKDSGHIEAANEKTAYDPEGNYVDGSGNPVTSSGGNYCLNGGECFNTHPNTLCPTGFNPYFSLNQYAGWGGGDQDLYYQYSVCIPQNYPISSKTPYWHTSYNNSYQVSYYSVSRLYSNQWTGSGGGAQKNSHMSFTWTLYCYPPGMTPPKVDTACQINNGEY